VLAIETCCAADWTPVEKPWSPARVVRELLRILVDLIDALRQPLLLAALALIAVLLVARFAMGSQ